MKIDDRPEASGFYSSAYERQSVWKRRHEGLPRPWTEDSVLDGWRFSNVFRELDTETVRLTKATGEAVSAGMGKADILFNTWLVRTFDRSDTWRAWAGGESFVARPVPGDLAIPDLLWGRKKGKDSGFTTAHMVPTLKAVTTAIPTVARIAPALVVLLSRCKDLPEAMELWSAIPSVGSFLSYQLALDSTYGPDPLCPVSTEAFAPASPATAAGLELVYGYKVATREASEAMVTLKARQEEWFERLGLDFSAVAAPGLGRMSLTAVAHWLGEYQRYHRIKYLGGTGQPFR